MRIHGMICLFFVIVLLCTCAAADGGMMQKRKAADLVAEIEGDAVRTRWEIGIPGGASLSVQLVVEADLVSQAEVFLLVKGLNHAVGEGDNVGALGDGPGSEHQLHRLNHVLHRRVVVQDEVLGQPLEVG